MAPTEELGRPWGEGNRCVQPALWTDDSGRYPGGLPDGAGMESRGTFWAPLGQGLGGAEGADIGREQHFSPRGQTCNPGCSPGLGLSQRL